MKITLKTSLCFTVKTTLCLVAATLFITTGCDKPTKACNGNNSLADLPSWLKEIVDRAIEDGFGWHSRIYQCTYKDGTGFLIT